MKLDNEANELLQRYLLAVKKNLGGPEREDITAEIESYIYDLLGERFTGPKEINPGQLETILREMGAPRKVAAQYAPQRYLIGPRLFPIYWLVLRILVAVVAGALILSMTISVIVDGETGFAESVLEFIGSLWSGVLSATGAVTLVFAIIERVSEDKAIDEIEELDEFKLSDLPELPEEEKAISQAGKSLEITLGILTMGFFTYLQNTGGYLPYLMNPGSEVHLARLFTENFLKFLPVIIALTGLEAARNITLLVQNRHSSLTNWWYIGAQCASVILSGFLLTALPLVTLDFFGELFPASDLTGYESLANTGLGIAIGLGILGSVVEIITKTIREIHHPAC